MAINMTFIDFVTPVPADWLNNVNSVVNNLLPGYPSGAAVTMSVNHTSRLDQKNILDYGGDNTGVGDNSAALTAYAAAQVAAHPHSIELVFPPGTYFFASAINLILTSTQSAPTALTIRGSGAGVTKFTFANTIPVSAMTISYGSAYTSVHMEGISFLAPVVGGVDGVTLVQPATFATGFGQYGLTTLRDLEFRGDDGFNEAHYWGTALYIPGASNINLYDSTFYGPTGTPSGSGVVLDYAPNDHSIIPIVFNMVGCSFTHFQSGLVYGGNWQGISILTSNFTANFSGIVVPVTAFANDQLLVNSCQFNNINDSILCQVWCQAVSIVNCFFLVENNSVGIALSQMANTSITGNIFSPSTGSPINAQGIQINTYSQGAAVITGNQFNQLTIGVTLLAASQFVNVQSNCYIGNGTNVSNAGTNNTIGGGSI